MYLLTITNKSYHKIQFAFTDSKTMYEFTENVLAHGCEDVSVKIEKSRE